MEFKQCDLVKLYRKMLELRAVDDRLVPLKLKDLVMDGFHPYVGEEAVAVGVCSSLRRDDYVVSTHRPQGHALAKGASMEAIFCEMLGRVGGPSKGLGGPMQWVDSISNFFCRILSWEAGSATPRDLALRSSGKAREGSWSASLGMGPRIPVLFMKE